MAARAGRKLLRLACQVLQATESRIPRACVPAQGGVISPLLANIYLNAFDRELTRRGYRLVRYADDFVILCRNERKAEQALAVAEQLLTQLRLALSHEKTRLVNWHEESFEFLGFWCKCIYDTPRRGPRAKARASFKNQVRYLTRRQQPRNLVMVIARLNPAIRGSR